ncbi:MAG: NUDIX hydrolase [Rhodospirillales bacterium]|nr:NUDIX hydrolase [Rhodospirillales bacterium]
MVKPAGEKGAPPVSVRGRRLLGENRVWNVYLDHIVGESGAAIEDYLVVEPKGLGATGIGGVAILPIWEGDIVLLKAYRHPVRLYTWELARGFLDPGEEPAAAALREMEEETGLTCAPADIRPLGYVLPESSTIAGKEAVFVALKCRPGGAVDTSEPGLGNRHRFSPQDVKRMLARYEIEDATAVVTLYRYFALGDEPAR